MACNRSANSTGLWVNALVLAVVIYGALASPLGIEYRSTYLHDAREYSAVSTDGSPFAVQLISESPESAQFILPWVNERMNAGEDFDSINEQLASRWETEEDVILERPKRGKTTKKHQTTTTTPIPKGRKRATEQQITNAQRYIVDKINKIMDIYERPYKIPHGYKIERAEGSAQGEHLINKGIMGISDPDDMFKGEEHNVKLMNALNTHHFGTSPFDKETKDFIVNTKVNFGDEEVIIDTNSLIYGKYIQAYRKSIKDVITACDEDAATNARQILDGVIKAMVEKTENGSETEAYVDQEVLIKFPTNKKVREELTRVRNTITDVFVNKRGSAYFEQIRNNYCS